VHINETIITKSDNLVCMVFSLSDHLLMKVENKKISEVIQSSQISLCLLEFIVCVCVRACVYVCRQELDEVFMGWVRVTRPLRGSGGVAVFVRVSVM